MNQIKSHIDVDPSFIHDQSSKKSEIPEWITPRTIQSIGEWTQLKNDINLKQFRSQNLFWLQNKSSYPILAGIALNILSIPVTSSEIERLFSILKDSLKPNRLNISIDNLEAEVMLRWTNSKK